MAGKEDFLVDCIITAGESDPDHYDKWLDNDLRHYEVAKHNVPYSEYEKWMLSDERWERVQELERIGRERFGEEYWMKYQVCCFCTSPHEG